MLSLAQETRERNLQAALTTHSLHSVAISCHGLDPARIIHHPDAIVQGRALPELLLNSLEGVLSL